jgi:hypothetical protein
LSKKLKSAKPRNICRRFKSEQEAVATWQSAAVTVAAAVKFFLADKLLLLPSVTSAIKLPVRYRSTVLIFLLNVFPKPPYNQMSFNMCNKDEKSIKVLSPCFSRLPRSIEAA